MFWQGKRVFITGHTGFKGSWLSFWLARLGATVTGFSLAPPTNPNLYQAADLHRFVESVIGDVEDAPLLSQALQAAAPEIVIHMAAQSLVRHSYQDPLSTYRTNVLGTANLLNAVRSCRSLRAVLVVTSDKCYENHGWTSPYRESDRLGGYDPYSSSKACAELVVSAYRESFFPTERHAEHNTAIATARAGNVIGGGDWAADRLIPDLVRALSSQRVPQIRNPQSTRPWQFVLEALRGYLMLAESLYGDGPTFSGAWNFGPHRNELRTVDWITRRTIALWDPRLHLQPMAGSPTNQPPEAESLKLNSSKAANLLHWRPVLSIDQALELTVDWYRRWQAGESASDLTESQLEQYRTLTGFNPTMAAA